MRRRREFPKSVTAIATLFAMIFFAALTQPALATEAPEPEARVQSETRVEGQNYIIDDAGRPIRVVFPLHHRLAADAFASASSSAQLPGPIRTGLRLSLQHSFQRDFPDEEVWWHFRHTWLQTAATWAGTGLTLNSTLLQGTYLRHDKSAFVVVPSAANLRFPAPFDVAFEYTLLDVEFDQNTTTLTSIDVVTFAFLLDFIRDPSYRHRLAVGPVLSYGLWRDDVEPAGEDEALWTHSFIPMTGGRLAYGWESSTGRLAAGGQAQCAAEAALFDQALNWRRRCSLTASGEWTMLAINDRPINLIFAASADEGRQRIEPDTGLHWSASLGLRLSLFGSN